MHEIDDMIARIEKESYTRAHKKSKKQYGIEGDDLRLISSTIISISVDGRKVTSPIGFTGGRIRLTVLNVFVPASEFNIIRSIISRLGKRTISLIPAPLILPKLIEKTDLSGSNSCLIDI
jgi:cell division ATPase FtsA